jgi:two-component system, NtrC family, sensor kinase
MIAQFEAWGGSSKSGKRAWSLGPRASKGRVLIVEDEAMIRESTGLLLEGEGYDVCFAENGREALRRLSTETPPDVIVLDLRMPVMNGWEFRTVQKDNPRFGLIPVLALSADGSAQAAAISAQGYLRKPVGASELLTTVERILIESKQQETTRHDETERLASLGRLAAGVGHEINNPLAFVMMNLRESLAALRPTARALEDPSRGTPTEATMRDLTVHVGNVIDMLQDCLVGAERIRVTVGNLQRLSTYDPAAAQAESGPVDIHQLIDQSISMVWNQIRHRARLVKCYDKIPPIVASGTALGQVFLNLIVNGVHAIPEGDADHNEIRITTKLEAAEGGSEVVVEIGDSGGGIAPEVLSHVFEPFFTTKPTGEGTGLGLSLSRQTVNDLGGRISVESSEQSKGTIFRVHLPVGAVGGRTADAADGTDSPGHSVANAGESRGRVLVIDDELLIGRAIQNAVKDQHDVVVVDRASEAISRMERGELFDVILCDVVMPDLSGPEFYATLEARWPELIPRLVFMTGGAFTPETSSFLEHLESRVLSKPFKIESLKRLVRERMARARVDTGGRERIGGGPIGTT